MPEAMRILDGDLFGKFQDYLSSLSQFELDACNASREAHVQALQDASKISREYNIRCFLRENPVFEWGPKYEFEACGNDEVTHLVQEQSGDDNSLNREARKWTTRVVRDERNLQRLNKMKQGLEGLTLKYAESPELHIESAVQETEVRLEKCREDLRRTETNHLRGEARLQLLRDVHVNVDTWLESARAQAAKELEESVSTPGYANKRRSLHNRSLRGASLANGAQMSLGGDDDFCDEDFIEDETFDEDDHIMMMEKDNLSLPSSDHSRSYPVTCTVSYPYQATRADELTISVGDRIDVVEDGDLDQWVKAKDGSGHVGYVPENYLEFPTNSTTPHHHYALPPGEDYTNTLGSTSSGSITSGTSSLTTNSSGNDPEVTTITSKAAINQDKKQGICLAKAIYEYEACSEEELTFPEGAIISVLSKDDNGIDDGWWKGELNGKVGVFPGLVVEELGSCDVNPTSSPSNSPTNDRPPSFRPPTPSSSPKATGRQKWNGSPDSGVNTLRHSPIPSSMLGVPDVNHGRTNSAPASPIYATVKPKPNRSAPAPPKRPVSFIRTTKP
uniref:SH3 domain-containing protein n=1 Tax=Ciona savignyi TaxID=51511 RepID=H2YMG0_CIOSA